MLLRNIQLRCSRLWCRAERVFENSVLTGLDLRERKWQKDGEYRIMTSFMIFAYQISLGWWNNAGCVVRGVSHAWEREMRIEFWWEHLKTIGRLRGLSADCRVLLSCTLKRGLDISGSWQEPLVGRGRWYEHCVEPAHSVKCWKFFELIGSCQLVMKDCAPGCLFCFGLFVCLADRGTAMKFRSLCLTPVSVAML